MSPFALGYAAAWTTDNPASRSREYLRGFEDGIEDKRRRDGQYVKPSTRKSPVTPDERLKPTLGRGARQEQRAGYKASTR
jgi:hypothetical protein